MAIKKGQTHIQQPGAKMYTVIIVRCEGGNNVSTLGYNTGYWAM